MRARDLGIIIGGLPPGPNDALTDVAGVEVGYETIVRGEDVRTGVTVILPFEGREPLFAAIHRLNGNGEMTGSHYIDEFGMLTSPIAITNTHSVGTVHEALVRYSVERGYVSGEFSSWALPVVAETWDGMLNDINGFHVKPHHVEAAIASAKSGPIDEGNVGGGTGMICHGFKGGTGTASRVVPEAAGGYTVGVLVQANHGRRERLRITGVPVGAAIGPDEVPLPGVHADGQGSIITVVATDAPLLPYQCKRLAQRAALGIGRTGGLGEDSSGDIIICFATGNRPVVVLGDPPPVDVPIRMLQNAYINPLFAAAVDATEEAIVNALLAAGTTTGYGGATAYRLPPERLAQLLR
ncbi:MAG TPA: P1 family peptidase [Chloroflexota bacterium]|nr:P1 family peptidase [Chloroflexota bacterium]